MAVARRTRRSTTANGSVDELKGLVDRLIKENQRLNRLLARMETKTVGTAASTVTKGLTAITRRLERALASTSTGRKSSGNSSNRSRRSTTAAPKARKPASPETQAKRLAALARAREARAAKKAATSS